MGILVVTACALPGAGSGRGNDVFAAPAVAPAQVTKSNDSFTLKEVQRFLDPSGSALLQEPLPRSGVLPSNPGTLGTKLWLLAPTPTFTAVTQPLPTPPAGEPTPPMPSPTPVWTPTPGVAATHTPTAVPIQHSPTSTPSPESSPTTTPTATSTPMPVEFVKALSMGQLVFGVDISPDGTKLAVALGNNRIEVMDVELGTSADRLREHNDAVNDVEYSPDGIRMVSASDDENAILWIHYDQWEIDRELEDHSDPVNAATFSPDGTIIATASKDQGVALWSVETGKRLLSIKGHSQSVNDVAFSPDGLTFATVSSDRSVKLWNVSDGSFVREFEGHQSSVNGVAFSPDGA
ncbi:MAG: WD40 repeat domain-containing protein, partial [Chloroflexi bacterium]|nr:WD40 repeat domain-containing protein [Chloroflexota bacterium]